MVPQTQTDTQQIAEILSHIYVNDNSSIRAGNKNKLFHLRSIITSLNINFQKIQLISEIESIDESMVFFKGRLLLKLCNLMKRAINFRVEQTCLGIHIILMLIKGKEKYGKLNYKQKMEGSVNEKMSKCRIFNTHSMTMDNYYFSIDLYEYVKKYIFTFRTVCTDRVGLQLLFEVKKLKRCELIQKITDQGISFSC